MNIIRIRVSRLMNADHFQFMSEFKNLFTIFTPPALKVVKLFIAFMKLFEEEDKCIIILKKSEYTGLMNAADLRRDYTFSGLVDLVNAAVKHFNAEVAAAGNRLKILFDTYGNLAAKNDKSETAGINNLVQDLEDRFAADIALIGATEWVAELKANNEAYETLVRDRYDETGEKPEAKMKQVRVEIDNAYRNLTTAIESLARLTDNPAETNMYNAFVGKLNIIITDYKNLIAQREGIAAAKKDKDKNPEIITSED